MHWFWRGTIATIFGACIFFVWVPLIDGPNNQLWVVRGAHSLFLLLDGIIGDALAGWALMLLPSVLSVVGVSLCLSRRPRPASRRAGSPECRWCGYNLTGNVSGVCPECGLAVPSERTGAKESSVQ